MSTLQDAEVKLRDLAGYRGQPAGIYALTAEDCITIADELDRLRGIVKNLRADVEQDSAVANTIHG